MICLIVEILLTNIDRIVYRNSLPEYERLFHDYGMICGVCGLTVIKNNKQ